MSNLCEKCKKHELQGFIFKNIEGESTEANDLGHILYKWVLRK